MSDQPIDPTRLPEPPADADGANGSLVRAARITAAMAIAHGVLIVTAFFLVRHFGPGTDPSAERHAEFYASDSNQQIVLIAGIYLIPFAGIAFIWFTVALRMWVQGRVPRPDALFYNIILICGIVYVSMLFAAGAALSLVSIDTLPTGQETGIALSSSFSRFGSSLFLIFALRMAAMIVFATTNLARRSDLLPRWFVLAGFPVGLLLMLTSSLNPLLVLVFPVWLVVLAVLLIRRAPELGLQGMTGMTSR